MSARLRDESGMALVAAILVMMILIGMGLAVVDFADSQQRGAAAERTRESGFNEAEAVLNAQVYQLTRAWPTGASQATWHCTPSTPGAGTTATTCPDPSSLNWSTVNPDYTSAPGCSTAAAWDTIVQDDDPAYGGTQYYDPVGMNPNTHAAVPYDANGNNSVWIRARANVRCRRQTIVALATRSLTSVQWPASALTADWFRTGNNGNKVIINTVGPTTNPPHQAGNVSLRCNASGHTTPSGCKTYKTGQVATDTIPQSPPGGTPVLNGTQINSLRDQAKATGTWYGGQDGAHPACPGSVSLSSAPAPPNTVVYFVEGSAGCTTSASGNSATNPVIFVLRDGKFSLGGNSNFYGLLYATNASNQNAPLVTLGGCAHIQGLVAVDGLGGVDVGSCKQNLVYDPTVLPAVKTYGGAVVAKNSFRVLPGNVPDLP